MVKSYFTSRLTPNSQELHLSVEFFLAEQTCTAANQEIANVRHTVDASIIRVTMSLIIILNIENDKY
ncbi:hypothetical protein DLR67_16925, partial [Vibrio paracholerae]